MPGDGDNKIRTRDFSGHHGFVVEREGAEGVRGDLDSADRVRRLDPARDGGVKGRVDAEGDRAALGPVVDWSDPDYVAARTDYEMKALKAKGLADEVSKLEKAFDGRRSFLRSRRPRESDLNAVLRRLDQLIQSEPDNAPSPALRSDVHYSEFKLHQLVSSELRFLFGKKEPALKAFDALKAAVTQNPSNFRAARSVGFWVVCAAYLTRFRGQLESELRKRGTSIDAEVDAAIKLIVRFQSDPVSQLYALELLRYKEQSGSITAEQRVMLEGVVGRLPALRAKYPRLATAGDQNVRIAKS